MINRTLKATTNKEMNRRVFLRLGLLAVMGIAVVVAACGTPAAGEAVDMSQDQSTERTLPTPTPQLLDEDWGVACPAGIINDPYPGYCKRYVDANNNGVCDFSEPSSGDVDPPS